MSSDPAIDLFCKVAAHHGVAWTLSDSPKFGSNALRVKGKIYAALTRSRCLLLKLPQARTVELLAAKRAERFESGGRMMNGWIILTPAQAKHWIELSDEACTFVTIETTRKRKSR